MTTSTLPFTREGVAGNGGREIGFTNIWEVELVGGGIFAPLTGGTHEVGHPKQMGDGSLKHLRHPSYMFSKYCYVFM